MRSPLLLRRFASLLLRRGSEHETDYEAMGTVDGGLEAEYLKVLEPELRGWGVPEHCATLQVQQVGHTPQASRDDGIRHRSVCGINTAFTRATVRSRGTSYLDIEISRDAGAVG